MAFGPRDQGPSRSRRNHTDRHRADGNNYPGSWRQKTGPLTHSPRSRRVRPPTRSEGDSPATHLTPHHIILSVPSQWGEDVTPRGLTQAVFSNRRSRPYSVAGRSSYLTAGSYTMYRRAHSCRQAASSRNVEFCPLRFPHKNEHT